MALRYITCLLLLLFIACKSPQTSNPEPTASPTAETAANQLGAEYANLNWKKLVKAAEEEEAAGNKAKAAALYQAAWQKKQNKFQYLHQAAELYAEVKDYRSAAEAYQLLQPKADDYPLVGLKYGRALKQDGQYDRAKRALARFVETYNEADRPIIEEMVTVEMAGIELAQQQAGQVGKLKLKRPEETINSEFDEYSPIPGEVGQLFFASNRGGESRIYESRQQGRDWSNAATPQGFPVIAEGEFGGGSISPDGERFYFTICSGTPGEDGTLRCEIFRSDRSPNGWGQPEPLPDYINTPGANNIHPHAAIINGREILYFSSDREGGRGGLDLWYAAREIGLSDGIFSYPANLGPVINTVGDELTPYYSNEDLSIYFSSNGHPSLGGQDVFKAAGEEVNWSRPENLGIPINSVADDTGFTIDRIGTGDGYLVSNRAFGGVKNNTTETDVFQVNINAGQILLKATAYDNQAGAQLSNIRVTLFQIYSDGKEEQLVQRDFPTGSYLFELVPNQRFRVEVTRAGYQPASYTFTTNLEGVTVYGQPLFMLPGQAPPATTPNKPNYPATAPDRPSYPSAGSTVSPANPNANTTDANTSPTTTTVVRTETPTGRYYKIQISAVKVFDANEGKYQSVKAIGGLGAESIPGRDLYRVTVGQYTSENEAKAALRKVQQSGFPSAFTVRYDDGVRYGRVNL
ncbi:MAG: SPOR domain-containing protein [Bacteroidota bacterium]